MLVTAGVAIALASTAGAAPSNVDLELNIGASLTTSQSAVPTLIPNGGTVNISRRTFVVLVDVSLITPAPGGRPKVRVELGGGLRWGTDDPDPTEGCTSTPTTGECQLPDLQPIPGQTGGGWFWDVVAPADGTYTFSGEVFDLPQPNPVLSNNSSTITIVVKEETAGSEGSSGGSGGGGSGGGGSGDSVAAGAVKLSPVKPKAGSTVVASARVTRGGSAIRPGGVRCSASIGKAKLRGTAKAASGVASCSFKTPKSAKGKRLTGSVSFRAGGQRFTKRFAARLG